jgi:hypothetical protein
MSGTTDIAWVTPARELHINPDYFNGEEALKDILSDFRKRKVVPKECKGIEYVARHEYMHLITQEDLSNPKSPVHALFRRMKEDEFISKNAKFDVFEFAAEYLSVNAPNKITTKLKKYYGIEE